MGSIDQRIVDLRFNNKQFEAGVKESMKSLEKLKKGLELEQSTKSLNGLNKAGQQFSLAGIASGVDDLNRRFSTMGIVGMTAVQEITKATIQLGRTMTNAVITPMVEGGKKRALNIEQAKFQFKGLGMDVEKTMESANAAVKGTAYGLDEAAKVASQLGASGLRAGDEMTKALTAVSGVAAMTSSSYEDIGNIFVKVAGNGRLMGQELLQLSGRGLNAAAVLAESMGISEQAVREMTSKGQISFEMFYTAMEEAFGEHATSANETFTGSLSNMNAALARIGASFATPAFENFRDIFNSIRPIIDDIHASMKPFIEEFNKFTRTLTDDFIVALGKIDAKHLFDFEPLVPILKGLRNVLVLISQAATAVKDAFNDIFPPKLPGEALAAANEFRKLSMNFRLSDETAANLKDTFKGLFAVVDIVKMAVEAFGKALGNTIKFFFPVADGLLGVTGNLGTYLVALRDVIKESDVFNKVFETLGKILQPVATLVRDAVTVIFDSLASFGRADTSEVDEFGERLAGGFKPFTLVADLVRGTFEILEAIMSRIGPLLATIGSAIGKGLKTVQQKIVGGIKNADFNQISRLLRAGASTSLIVGIKKFFDSLRKVTDGSAGILDSIKGIFTGLSDTLRTFQKDIQADTLMKIAKAILILTASVTVLSMIDEKKLASSLMAISALMGELFGSMAIFEKVVGSAGFRGITKITFSMMALSTSVLILAGAMKTISNLDWNQLAKGLLGVGVLIGELVAAVHLMPDEGKMMKGAFGLVLFAQSIKILSKSVEKFAGMNVGELTQGLIGVGVLLTELALFMNVTDLDGMGMLKGLGIMNMAIAIVILSNAVKKLAALDFGEMVQGLLGVGIILTELAVFMNMTGDAKKIMSTAIGMQVLSVAMVIFASAISSMGKLTWEELAKGLIGFGGALGIVATALHFIEGALGGAAALLVVAGAIAILTPALILLGQMEMAEIGKSLLILAGALGVLGGASALLAPVIPAMLGLAGALTLLSVAIALIGGGIFALSAGITALSIAGAVGIQTLIDAVDGLIGLIPKALEHVANGLLQFVRIIGEGAPGIVNAVAAIFVAISEAVIKAVPAMVKAVMVFLTTMLDAIVTFVPELVVAGMQLVLGILQGIADNIGEVVVVAIEVVVNFIEGIASMIPEVIQAGFDLIIAFVNGLADAIRGNTDTLIDAMHNLMSAMIEAALKVLTSSIRLFKGKGQDMMSKGLGKGITDKVSTVVKAAKEAPKKALSAIGEHIKDFFTIGGDMMAGMAKGIANGVSKVTDAAKNVARKAIEAPKKLLGIRSPSTVFSEIGTNLGQGLTKGMDSQQKPVEKSGEKLGEKTTEGAAKGITKAKPKVVKAASKTSKATYESTKEWIDKQRKYHELSLEDELSKWKQIQLKYKKGSEERLEIDKRMKDIRKQMIKDEFDHSVNWINEEKYYKRLSLAEELAAWERVQARYYKGTEERKKADREVFRVKQELLAQQQQLDEEYYNKSKEINDKLEADIKSLTDEYERAVEARTKALVGAFGLFDAIEDYEEVSGRELMQNLQDQVNAFANWADDVERLAKRGIDEGLLEELREMGPKAAPQLEALNRLTDSELSFYSELWRTKHVLARQQAVKELEGMKTNTGKKIEELKKDSEKELEALKGIWEQKTIELSSGVQTNFKEMNTQVNKTVKTMKKDTNKEMTNMVDDMKKTMTSQNWESVGKSIVQGITAGVRKNADLLINAVRDMSQSAITTAEQALGINSPSRVFEQIGLYSVEGLAIGLNGREATTRLGRAIAEMSDILESDFDMSPTIRPVIDMDDAIDQFNSAFTGSVVTASTAIKQAGAISTSARGSGVNDISDNEINNKYEITNEFKVEATIREESDIRKVAQEFFKLQQQSSRGRGVLS